jgi:hypothetical protein
MRNGDMMTRRHGVCYFQKATQNAGRQVKFIESGYTNAMFHNEVLQSSMTQSVKIVKVECGSMTLCMEDRKEEKNKDERL